MKIGILTLPLHFNYGGILQAYALQKILNNMGHQVELINYPIDYPHKSWSEKIRIYLGRIYRKFIKREKIYIQYEKIRDIQMPIITTNTQKFINKHINLSYEVTKITDIDYSKYDSIIVGSDQIWRRAYSANIANNYLSFIPENKIKKIAYAVSFGTEIWDYSKTETKLCKYAIQDFKAVSVREKSALNICRTYLNKNATLVLDPTMLLHQKEYNDLIKDTKVFDIRGDLFEYILDPSPDITNIINHISILTGYKSFKVNAIEGNIKCDINEKIAKPVEVWIKSIRDSKIIITDSFHACIFSIIYKKNFYVIMNNSRGKTRITSLLSLFGLEDRIIKSCNDIAKITEIKYDNIEENIDKLSLISLNFLHSNLK